MLTQFNGVRLRICVIDFSSSGTKLVQVVLPQGFREPMCGWERYALQLHKFIVTKTAFGVCDMTLNTFAPKQPNLIGYVWMRQNPYFELS